MSKGIRASLLLLLVLTQELAAAAAQSPGNQAEGRQHGNGRHEDQTGDARRLGEHRSRGAAEHSNGPDGSLKPFYLKRAFKYLPSDRFELEIVNSADPYGAVPLARIRIGGHMLWQGAHPIAPGAQKVDFVADESLRGNSPRAGVCRRSQQGRLRRIRALGGERTAKHFRKDLRSLRSQGRHELHGVRPRLSQGRSACSGARATSMAVASTREQNRPTNLQIPLIRK